MDISMAIILCVGAIFASVCVARPRWIWKIDHFLSVKNGEPTDLYIAIVVTAGIVSWAIVVFGLVLILIQ